MAITTLDGALAGFRPLDKTMKAATGVTVIGRPFNPMYLAGVPGAAVAPVPGVAGAALTSYPGQVAFPAAVGGQNIHLGRMTASSTAQGGTLMLCDRLWHNSGLSPTVITAQTVGSVAWPARDRNAAVAGDGVLIGMEISTVTGAGANVPSISYTNSLGVAGKTTGLQFAYAAASLAGTFYPFGLAAGDVGVQSIQTQTNTVSMTSGVYHLVAYRVLAELEMPLAGVPYSLDPLTGALPRCYDGTVPFLLFIPSAVTTTQLNASVVFTQG